MPALLAHLEVARPLFDGWEETLIWSCLEGCMGTVFADHADCLKKFETTRTFGGAERYDK